MQMYPDAKFPCAGREMRELLRRIDKAGAYNSDGIGQLEPVLSRNRFSIPTPSDVCFWRGGALCICHVFGLQMISETR